MATKTRASLNHEDVVKLLLLCELLFLLLENYDNDVLNMADDARLIDDVKLTISLQSRVKQHPSNPFCSADDEIIFLDLSGPYGVQHAWYQIEPFGCHR